MNTAPTNKKIREIITAVGEGKILPRPEFQRRLVWKIQDKNHFLDSVLRGYPFPEIYLANGDVNLETGEGTQLLVDGLQRVSTLVQYFNADPALKLVSVLPYKSLSDEQKTAFLQYDVAVRDLGAIPSEEIIEVFQRINSTKYSLTDIEINNALYRGELKEFAQEIADNKFFSDHDVFSAEDYRRMGDLRYALTIIVTTLGGYFNRDDELQDYLEQYNDYFPQREAVRSTLLTVFSYIEECGFDRKSRIWRKADLFTILCELYFAFTYEKISMQPIEFVSALSEFYDTVEKREANENNIFGVYYKAALQASNDRKNRVRRAVIIAGVMRGDPEEQIFQRVAETGLL